MISIKQIIEYLQGQGLEITYFGEEELLISGFSSIAEIQDNTVTWLRKYNEEYVEEFKSHQNILLVTTQEVYEQIGKGNCIGVANPKMCFFEIVKKFFIKKEKSKISKLANIRTEKIGENVSIGDYCNIGKDVVIGNNTVIKENVSIECPTVIGNNCVISSGVVIGSEGFGYYRDLHGNNEVVPHVGGVHIGNYVDIGANTCIDRGTINDTVIGSYTKIDNLCHIAHNVKIGENVFVIALSMIGGSSVLENGVYIAPGAKIMNQLHIGSNAFVGTGAVVTQNVKENDVVVGVPAKVIRKRTAEDRE